MDTIALGIILGRLPALAASTAYNLYALSNTVMDIHTVAGMSDYDRFFMRVYTYEYAYSSLSVFARKTNTYFMNAAFNQRLNDGAIVEYFSVM